MKGFYKKTLIIFIAAIMFMFIVGDLIHVGDKNYTYVDYQILYDLDYPQSQLNNHSLREVFEDGNLITTININKPVMYGNNTLYYITQVVQTVNVTLNDYYYETTQFNIKAPTVNTSLNTSFQHPIGGLNRVVSSFNHGVKEYLTYRQSAKWQNIWATSSISLAKVVNVAPTTLFFDVDDYIQTTNNHFINMTSYGISSLTVQQMDYWFNIYMTLKGLEA